MMEREWKGLLTRYGQPVVLHQGERTLSGRAFVQPIRESGQEQLVPSPLGLRREDRFLYLGTPEHLLKPGDWLECEGGAYEVCSAHPIPLGSAVLYLWAVLRPRDLEEDAG